MNSTNQCADQFYGKSVQLRGVVGAHPTPRCSPAAALALISDAPSAICCCRSWWPACVRALTRLTTIIVWTSELPRRRRTPFGLYLKPPPAPLRHPAAPPVYMHIPAFGYICVHAINLNNWAVHVPRGAAHRQSIHSPHAKAKSRPVRIGASHRRVCCAGLRGRRESGTILQAN